jgi:hypothetical protein
MTGLVRRATLFTAVGLMAAAAAMAGVPTAGNSSIGDPIIILRAFNGAGPGASAVDASLPKTMIIRDAANNPVPNSVVVLNFSGCGVVKIASVQPAGFFANCAAKTVSGVTDAAGSVTFRVVGASNTTLPSEGLPVTEGCVSVTADGVALGNLSAATPDLNGALMGGKEGMDGVDTAQYTGIRFPGASVPTPPPAGPCVPGPGCFQNANYRTRANYIFGNPTNTGVAFQFVDGQDTAAFALFRFGPGRRDVSGSNGPFCLP